MTGVFGFFYVFTLLATSAKLFLYALESKFMVAFSVSTLCLCISKLFLSNNNKAKVSDVSLADLSLAFAYLFLTFYLTCKHTDLPEPILIIVPVGSRLFDYFRHRYV